MCGIKLAKIALIYIKCFNKKVIQLLKKKTIKTFLAKVRFNLANMAEIIFNTIHFKQLLIKLYSSIVAIKTSPKNDPVQILHSIIKRSLS